MNIRVLVTGGAGFIGSSIVDELVKMNKVSYIRILDNLSTGKVVNMPISSKVEFMYGDISDLEICRKSVNEIDVICHQAALGSVPRSIEDPFLTHKSNVNGFLNILIAAKEKNIKRIVFASSSSVYGDSHILPKNEGEEGDVLSPYAASKYIDEIYAGVFNKCYGMECIGLRYFNVFGPKQDADNPYAAVIPRFIKFYRSSLSPIINGDGTFSRDFTYIDNVVHANIRALFVEGDKKVFTNYNIGTGTSITMNQLALLIQKSLNSNLLPIYGPERKGDPPHSQANISKATQLLGYSVLVNFEDGLKKLIYCDSI